MILQRRFTLLPDREKLSRLWQTLVEARGVTGFRAHDVRLVALFRRICIPQELLNVARGSLGWTQLNFSS
jgi:hypothetical protein